MGAPLHTEPHHTCAPLQRKLVEQQGQAEGGAGGDDSQLGELPAGVSCAHAEML